MTNFFYNPGLCKMESAAYINELELDYGDENTLFVVIKLKTFKILEVYILLVTQNKK